MHPLAASRDVIDRCNPLISCILFVWSSGRGGGGTTTHKSSSPIFFLLCWLTRRMSLIMLVIDGYANRSFNHACAVCTPEPTFGFGMCVYWACLWGKRIWQIRKSNMKEEPAVRSKFSYLNDVHCKTLGTVFFSPNTGCRLAVDTTAHKRWSICYT